MSEITLPQKEIENQKGMNTEVPELNKLEMDNMDIGSEISINESDILKNIKNDHSFGPKKKKTLKKISNDLRLSLIKALDGGMSMNHVCMVFDIPYPTLSSIYRNYNIYGKIEAGKRGGNRPKKLSETDMDLINSYIEQDCSISIKEIREKLLMDTQIEVAASTLYKNIKGFHFTLRRENFVLQPPASLDLEGPRRLYSEFILKALSGDQTLVFFAESEFQVAMRRFYERPPDKGQHGAASLVPKLRRVNKTVLAAITKDGLLAYKTESAASTRVSLAGFWRALCDAIDGKRLTNVLVVMDNALFDRCPEIAALAKSRGYRVMFLPEYSPQLSPMEAMFAQWKSGVRLKKPTNEQQLLDVVDNFRNVLTAEQCSSYFQTFTAQLVQCVAGGTEDVSDAPKPVAMDTNIISK